MLERPALLPSLSGGVGIFEEVLKLNNHRLKPVGLNNGLKVRIRVD